MRRFLIASVLAVACAAAGAQSSSGNVYQAGGEVRSGAIAGDYTAAGGKIVVDQRVEGDASLAGGSIEVRAPVGDDLRAIGGDIRIDSSVGGEVFASGGNVVIGPSATVARGVRAYGGSVTIDGRVDGDVNLSARRVVINGQVTGSARLAAEEIELGPTARIAGALSYASGSDLKQAPGATVGGVVAREEAPRERKRERKTDRADKTNERGGPFGLWRLFSYLGLLAFAAVLLLIAPAFAGESAERIKSSPWLALAIGFVMMLAVPVLAVLLFVTILGIPLGLAVLALYPVLLLTGFVVGVLFVARLLPSALRRGNPESYQARVGYFALALLLIVLLGALPAVGGLLLFLVALAGLGAGVLELNGRRQARTVAA